MKTYIVTGGAQGIGQAITERLLQEGNKVYIFDKQKTDFVEDRLVAFEGKCLFYKIDLAERDDVANGLERLKYEKFDGVVNNAGEVYLEEWDKFSLPNWDRTLAVNLTAPIQIVHKIRKSLNKGGSIVNVSSMDAETASYYSIAYAASKAALLSLTRSLAANLGPQKIRVNAVAPGWVVTEESKESMPEEAKELAPMKRNATAEDIANVVAFLLSDQALAINGTTLFADDGLSVVDYTLWAQAQPDY